MASSRKPKKKTSGKVPHAPKETSTPDGIILERFKRLNSLPNHSVDLVSQFFIDHYLRHKRPIQ